MIDKAIKIVTKADFLIIVGTSLVVYPAAGLIKYTRKNIPIFIIDPNKPDFERLNFNIHYYKSLATSGIEKVRKILVDKYL